MVKLKNRVVTLKIIKGDLEMKFFMRNAILNIIKAKLNKKIIIKKITTCLILLFVLISCAHQGMSFMPVERQSNESLIYIYRPKQFVGGANSFNTFLNDSPRAKLSSGTYFSYQTKSDSLTIYTVLVGNLLNTGLAQAIESSLKLNRTSFDIKTKKTYYIKASPAFTKFKFELVPNAQGEKEILNCTYAESAIERILSYDKSPHIIKSNKPLMPNWAKEKGLSNVVYLEIEVFEDGSVGQVEVKKSLYPKLDAIAIDSIKTWNFEPAMKDDKAIAVWFIVTFEFE